MQRLFSIYPHHGYLNTGIYISCLSSERNISITCRHDDGQDSHEELYSLDSFGRLVFLPAGKHTFFCRLESGEEQTEEIIIEDAIKLGGGKLVGGCLSGKSNWCVIKMTDRLYFHNISSGEEYFEMSVVPDKMRFLNEHTLLFFSKGSGYSIYSFNSRRIENQFDCEPIFQDGTRIVLQEDKESVVIIDIANPDYPKTVLKGFNFKVSQDEAILYYHTGSEVITYDLHSNGEIHRVKIVGEFISVLSSGHYLSRVSTFGDNWQIRLYSAQNNKVVCYPKARYSIVSCLDYIYEDVEELKSKFNDFCNTLSDSQKRAVYLNYSTFDDFNVVGNTVYYTVSEHSVGCSGEDTVKVLQNSSNETKVGLKKTSVKFLDGTLVTDTSGKIEVYRDGTVVKSIEGKVVGKYLISDENPQSLKYIDGRLIAKGELLFNLKARTASSWSSTYLNLLDLDCYIKNIDGKSFLFRVGNGKALGTVTVESAVLFDGILILSDSDKKQFLAITNNSVTIIDESTRANLKTISDDLSKVLIYDSQTFKLLDTRNGSQPTPILTSIYDSTSYNEALFAADDKCIILSDKHNQFYFHNLASGERTEFDPGIFVKHINGYRPLLDLKPRQPRVIDPVSGQLIAPSAFENYVFYSPDGSCHVGTKSEGKMSSISNIEYKHIFENRYISSQEYWEYSKLNIPPVTNASDKVQEARLQLMLDHPSWFVNRFKNITANTILNYASGKDGIDEHDRKKLDLYVKYAYQFTDAFISSNEYIMLYSSYSSAPRKVDLGIPLWYINYISFSYNGKMMALAGRYPNNTVVDDGEQKRQLSGLFLLYDIEEDRIVYKRTDTYAVWVTAFNKDGLVAFYDSKPNTYILESSNPDSPAIDNNSEKIKDIGCIAGRNFLCFSPSGKYVAMSEQGYVCYSSDISSWGHQPSTNVYIRGCKNLNKDIAHYNDHGDNISGIAVRQQTVSMVAFSTDDSKLLSVSNDGVIVVRNLHLE